MSRVRGLRRRDLDEVHRRRDREEVLAPWMAMALILCGWAVAATFVLPATTPPDIERLLRVSTPAAPEATQSVPSPEPVETPAVGDEAADVAELRRRELAVPVWGVEPTALASTFGDAREGGRSHEALDIAAPLGTSVVAADAGTIVKLFESKPGGTTIYQFDPTGTFCYYYAHLDDYVPGLAEGDTVERGQTIGYVGTSGNASPDAPHLHFAILRLGPERRWWEGVPIDPYRVLR